MIDVPVHVPEQQLGVEIGIAELADSSHAPCRELLDHRAQLGTHLGEHVADFAALGEKHLDGGAMPWEYLLVTPRVV